MLDRFGVFDLRVRIGKVVVFHDDFELVDLNVACFVIVGHFHVHIFAEAAQHRSAHRVFKRVDEHVAVKAFVLADLVNGLFKFKIHGCLRLLALRRKYLWFLHCSRRPVILAMPNECAVASGFTGSLQNHSILFSFPCWAWSRPWRRALWRGPCQAFAAA